MRRCPNHDGQYASMPSASKIPEHAISELSRCAIFGFANEPHVLPQFRPAQCADLASRHGWQCRWWLRWLVWWRHWQTRRHRQRRRHVNWQRQNRRRHLNRQRQRRRWHHRLHRQCLRARAGRRKPIRLCATLLLVVALGMGSDGHAMISKWPTSLLLWKEV